MDLPGLITVKPDQHEIIEKLAQMMGISFMEEVWTAEWLAALDALGTTEKRKKEISQAIMKYDFIVGARYGTCYMLPDMSAGAGAYVNSGLGGHRWEDLEHEANRMAFESILDDEEARILEERADELAPVSDLAWPLDHAQGADFIYFYALGVDPNARGTGAFRRLMDPFCAYADEHALSCYLDCYSDRLEGLYGHFGFKTIKNITDPRFPIDERCMVRIPQSAE